MAEKEQYLDPRDKVIVTVVVSTALLLLVIALCLVGRYALDQDTQRLQTCVTNGGTWTDGSCLVLTP